MRPLVQLVAFEGPDRYSFVGGLATRMNDLAEALVARGYTVRHLFVGDPDLPHLEQRLGGKLVLERWGQWISAYHPKDVYDGEYGKWKDFSRTVPAHLVGDVIAPAAERGQRTVLLFEDWQTADAAIGTALLLAMRELRGAASLFWNANNTYGFGEVDFAAPVRDAIHLERTAEAPPAAARHRACRDRRPCAGWPGHRDRRPASSATVIQSSG